MMNRPRFAVTLTLLFVLSLVRPVAAGQAPAAAASRHTLWKVESKTNTVYLLGSVHLLKPEHYPLPAVIESAFTNAKVAAFETDIGSLEQPDTQFKLLARASLPDGQTLSQQLSPAVYASFSRHAQDSGFPSMTFDQMKPAVAAMMLEVIELQKFGLDPEYGVDKHFYGRAKKEGKEVLSLEPVDFQISLVTDLPKGEGELWMKSTLSELDKLKTQYDETIAAWQAGDAAKLEKLLNESMRESPAIYKRLVSDRSRSWVPRIEDLLRKGEPAIVIVGAGHLVGNDGLVELLKKKGFKVTQL
jgi:uncharacterized protein